jgi:hypothetical protein
MKGKGKGPKKRKQEHKEKRVKERKKDPVEKHKEDPVDESDENLVQINEAVAMIKNQIKAERAQIPKDSRELKIKYNEACRDLENIQKEIDKNKLKATRLKYRIDAKKLRYEHLLEPKPENWPKIYARIKELGDQIVACESAIIALELQKHAAEQAREWALISWHAYKEGAHKKPLEKDPRMKAVLGERERVERHIKKKRAELKRGSRGPKRR